MFWNLNYHWFQRVHDNKVLVVDVVFLGKDTCRKSCMGFCKWERVKHGGHPPCCSLGFYLTSLPKLWPWGHSRLPKWQDSLTCLLAIIFLFIWWSEVYVNLPIKIYFQDLNETLSKFEVPCPMALVLMNLKLSK